MKRRPFLFIGLASFFAAMLCTLLSPPLAVVMIVISATCLLVGAACCPSVLTPSVTVLTGIIAVSVSLLFAARVAFTVNPQLSLNGTTASVTMRVEETVSTAKTYIVRVESGTLKTGTRLCFWINQAIAPKCGDLLTADIDLVAAYNTATEDGNAAKANGVYLYAWPSKNSTLVWEDGQSSVPLLQKALYSLRDRIHATLYRHLDFDTAALAEGIMLGRRDNLSASARYAFRASGTYHLLAVSGTHLGILTGAVLFLLRKTPCSRRTIALLTMLCVIAFTALCGFTASVTRAGVMMLIVLSGQLFRRRADGLNSIGCAAAVMLLFDPFCIYDIGWQLSFSATLGLLLIVPVWDREITHRLIKISPRVGSILAPISTATGVTVSATLTTLPLSAYHFGSISTMFLPGNLLCVPPVSVLLLLYFAAVLCSFIPFVSDLLFSIGELLSRFLTACTTRLSAVSISLVYANPFVTGWLFALIVALLIGYYRRRMRGVFRASVVMLSLLLVGNSLYTAAMRSVTHLAAAPCSYLAVSVKTHNTSGLILSSPTADVNEAAMLLYDEGIYSLDWLLWLGEPCDVPLVLSSLCVSAECVMTVTDSDEPQVFADVLNLAVFEDGGSLSIGSTAVLQRNGDFIRLMIGDTAACLVATNDDADANTLPSDWHQTEWLCTRAAFADMAHIGAARTTVFCSHGDVDTQKQLAPDAVIALESETQSLTLRNGTPIKRQA